MRLQSAFLSRHWLWPRQAGRLARARSFTLWFRNQPLELESVTAWPPTSPTRRAASFLMWTSLGPFWPHGHGGRCRFSCLKWFWLPLRSAPSSKTVLSVPLCARLGPHATGHVRGQRAQLLPDSLMTFQAELVAFATRLELVLGALSSELKGHIPYGVSLPHPLPLCH